MALDTSKIKKLTQTEKPIYNNYNSTSRSFCNNVENSAIFKYFDKRIESEEELLKLLKEIIVRFDTSPNYYQKEDYFALIKLLYGSLSYIYEKPSTKPLEWEEI